MHVSNFCHEIENVLFEEEQDPLEFRIEYIFLNYIMDLPHSVETGRN